LTDLDRRLLTAIGRAVACLQDLARGWLRQEFDRVEERTTVFEAACAQAGISFSGANLIPILGGADRAAAAAAMGVLAERSALGHPAMGGSTDGHREMIAPTEFAEVSDEIARLEDLELMARLESIAADPEVAGLLVGVHLAREGNNDLFAFPAWSDPVRAECVLGVAIAAAALSALVEPENAGQPAPAPSGPALHVVQAAYAALSDEDQEDLQGGFGVLSRVIEACLLASEWLDDPDPSAAPDSEEQSGAADELAEQRHQQQAHRLSAKLVDAFLAGRDGIERPDFTEETAVSARTLLRTATAVGRAIADNEEPSAEPSLLPFARQLPPSARNLLN
jgi:hypothetical protein